jgi:hypothetical protein
MRIGRIVAPSLLLVFATTMLGFAPSRGNRIGVLQTSDRHRGRAERALTGDIPRVLRDELRRAGVDASVLTRSYDEIGPEESFDYLVEVIFEDVDAGYTGGVSAGVPVGDVGVGAEVAMAYARVDARVMVYDGRTMEVVRNFNIHAFTNSPAVTGIGIGGRDGFLFVRLPLRARAPYRRITRELARNAASQITAR